MRVVILMMSGSLTISVGPPILWGLYENLDPGTFTHPANIFKLFKIKIALLSESSTKLI